MRLLVDENLPRSLVTKIAALGFDVQDVRDIGLQGRPDDWPEEFSAGVIFVNLPDTATATQVSDKVVQLLTQRLPVSLLGAVTMIEETRALSRIVRCRPKSKANKASTDGSKEDDKT